tara:strand:+ start:13368 stop:14567 length:1200 start_codon:yes stop_codon:yes gene_type:complete
MTISEISFKKKEKNKGKIKLLLNGESFSSDCIATDDSYYINLGEGEGIKIIKDNKRYHSLEETNKNLSYFKDRNFDSFPKIINHNIDSDKLVMRVEHIEHKSYDTPVPIWMPPEEKTFLKERLQAPLGLIDSFNNFIIKEKLNPEDEWCKSKNIVDRKIVDFHRFRVNTDRYEIPTEAKPEDCSKIFNNAVKRYLARGDNKWKGKIYQGHNFSNGHTFEGYSSDGKVFDSYRKLNFYHLNKAKGKKVLDIGCNEGFFSTQASLAGAKSVTSIDLCQEDIMLASEIRDEITGLNNIEYINTDAVDFIKNDKNKYNLTFLSSVLHQIYPNNKGAHNFMADIASRTEYLCIESPFGHKLMNVPLSTMFDFLCDYFDIVRFLFAYDAYSSGYRAIFVCHNPKL